MHNWRKHRHSITYVIAASTGNHPHARRARAIMNSVGFYSSTFIGFFLGFGFGVGCALAVMYSIYTGGYRAAVKDALLPVPPARLLTARAKAVAADRSARG